MAILVVIFLWKEDAGKVTDFLHIYLFIQIRENNDIHGIKIGDHEIKLCAYPDDADFLTSDVRSLLKLFKTCATFQSYSSPKLNLEKSEACWIGVKQGCSEKPVDCKWIDIKTGAIRALGVFNSYDTDLVEKLNFLDNFKALVDVCNLWQYRGLSLTGKILIFKTVALSKLVYSCTMKTPSKNVVDQLNSIHKNFIWNNKKPKIKHSTLIADYEEGYKDVGIKSETLSLKVPGISKLLGTNFHPWKIIPNEILSEVGGANVIFHFNFKLSKQCPLHGKICPDFIMYWLEHGLVSVKMTQKMCLKFLARFYGITSI